MARATRRCWAPSCRSRSMRRRSASPASTAAARLASTLVRRADSWATLALGCSSDVATHRSRDGEGPDDPRRGGQQRQPDDRGCDCPEAGELEEAEAGLVLRQRRHVRRQGQQGQPAGDHTDGHGEGQAPDREQDAAGRRSPSTGPATSAARRTGPTSRPPPAAGTGRRGPDRAGRPAGSAPAARARWAAAKSSQATGTASGATTASPREVASRVTTTVKVSVPTQRSRQRWASSRHVLASRQGRRRAATMGQP